MKGENEMVQNLAPTIKFQTKCGKAIDQFLNEVRKKSKHTERNYRGDIRRFIKYAYDGKTIDTITSEELDLLDFESFTQYIESFVNVSNTTINRHISTIKSLYRKLKAMNILESDINYLELIYLLNNDGTEIEYMSMEVVERYIEEAGREKNNAEVKRKLIKLAADQGIRLESLLELTWKNFAPREDGIVITGYDKGNKRYTKVMSFEEYENLLEIRKGALSNEKVFSPLSVKNVTDMMTRLKKSLGYEDREYSFHSLRKAAGTWGYRFSGDILEAQRILGHNNLNTTQLYTQKLDYGVMGMFSLRGNDPELYKKITHIELLEAIGEMNKDAQHLLNAKISAMQKRKAESIEQ